MPSSKGRKDHQDHLYQGKGDQENGHFKCRKTTVNGVGNNPLLQQPCASLKKDRKKIPLAPKGTPTLDKPKFSPFHLKLTTFHLDH